MAGLPEHASQLVNSLRRLPGIGFRTAERLAVKMLMEKDSWPEVLAQDILKARRNTTRCPECGFFSENSGLCEICCDPARDRTIICVVEGPYDVLTMERAGGYRGLYHCLGGKLSPLDGVSLDQLSLDLLMSRLSCGAVKEVVLAMGSDVEGETTTLQLVTYLKKTSVKISRLAQGISVGGRLDTHDAATLAHAVALRQQL